MRIGRRRYLIPAVIIAGAVCLAASPLLIPRSSPYVPASGDGWAIAEPAGPVLTAPLEGRRIELQPKPFTAPPLPEAGEVRADENDSADLSSASSTPSYRIASVDSVGLNWAVDDLAERPAVSAPVTGPRQVTPTASSSRSSRSGSGSAPGFGGGGGGGGGSGGGNGQSGTLPAPEGDPQNTSGGGTPTASVMGAPDGLGGPSGNSSPSQGAGRGGSPSANASPIAFNHGVVAGLPAGGIGANPLLLPTKPGTDLSEEAAAATALGRGSSQIAGVTTQQTTSVPEPSSLLMLGGGLALAVRRLKQLSPHRR